MLRYIRGFVRLWQSVEVTEVTSVKIKLPEVPLKSKQAYEEKQKLARQRHGKPFNPVPLIRRSR